MSCYPACLSYMTVNRVMIVDETPYLHAVVETDEHCYSREDHYFVSNNNGKNWKEVFSLPFEMPVSIENPENVQLSVCVPDQPQTCYRIAGKERVEISRDGGATWKTDWKLPIGRKKYLERDDTINRLGGVDTIPFDLGIAVRKIGHLVIVPMGNQGVLVKSTEGKWTRYPVAVQHKLYERFDQAYPPPFFASTVKEAADAVIFEMILSGLLAALFFIIITITAWIHIEKHEHTLSHRILPSSLPFFLLMIVFFILISNDFHGLIPYDASLYSIIKEGLQFLFPFIGWVVSWTLIIVFAPNRKSTLLLALFTLGWTFLFLVVINLVFFAWTFGIIPVYEIALIIAILSGFFTIRWGFRNEKRIALLTARETFTPV